MSILAHPPGSNNENFRLQLTGFSVSALPNVYRVYGTAGFQQLKWGPDATVIENLYHGTAAHPDFATLDGRADCAHTKDPRLWDGRCSTDAIGYFWKRVGCPAGETVACQDNDRWNAAPGRYNITSFPSPSVWPLTTDFGTKGYAPIINHKKVNGVQLQPAATDCRKADTIWVADVLPRGAVAGASNDSWNWVASPEAAPFPGRWSHQSSLRPGTHHHYFSNAASTLAVNQDDVLVGYVFIDPANPPSQIMLQWHTAGASGSWEHRAYWAASPGPTGIPWGAEGTDSRRYMGPLPPAGEWARLEVPAALVGLEGATLNGMGFALFGGRATWDHAGKATPGTHAGRCPPKTGRTQADTFHAYNPDEYATGTANSKVTEVKYADGSSRWFMAFNSMIKHVSVTYRDAATGTKKNDSLFGKSAADNWRVLWATSPDGVTWAVHPQTLFRSVSERDTEWSGMLVTDMLVDNGYFYVLFNDLRKNTLYLARARVDPANQAAAPGYIHNSSEGWSIATCPGGGPYTWLRLDALGEQLDVDNVGGTGVAACPVMPTIGVPAPVKQGSLARIFKSATPFSSSRIFGVTSDAGVVRLWSAPDIMTPLAYESDVTLDPSIVTGGNGWEFGFTRYSDNSPATPRAFGPSIEVWVVEKTPDTHVLLTRRHAQLSNF